MPVQSVNSFGLDVAMSFSLLAVSRHSNSNGKKFYYILWRKSRRGVPGVCLFSVSGAAGWMASRQRHKKRYLSAAILAEGGPDMSGRTVACESKCTIICTIIEVNAPNRVRSLPQTTHDKMKLPLDGKEKKMLK